LGFATHNRSGYISYCYNAQTGKYDFRIYTYTNASSTPVDRCDQILYISDTHGNLQDSVVCPRINNDPAASSYCIGGCSNCGDLIVSPYGGYGGVKANIYAGSLQLNLGFYVLTMIDPNRDAGIINLGGSSSSNIVFALVDTMYAYAGIAGVGYNCTPTITNPPIQNACAGSPWCYNPGAVDPENDSLDFSITKSMESDPNNSPSGVEPIGIETFPNNLQVDRHTGTLCWRNVSSVTGEYNIALLIKEYRKNPYDGKRYLVGVTLFDIQILVILCPPNSITFQNAPHDTCIVAGTSFSTAINVSGSGITPPLTLSATGLPFSSTTIGPHPTLTSSSSGNSVSGVFSWSPSCLAVQANPYQITLQAYDNTQPLANANFSTFNIHVVSPPPLNLTAAAVGDSILLHWNAPIGCGQTSGNSIQKYLIYRITGCTPFTPNPCETGIPSGGGYTLIGTTTNTVTTFADNNLGAGFPPGNTYSYIVVAEFGDGSFSIASSNVCITTKLNVPLMMKVSVDTTDALVGRMLVWWNKPLANATDFDTIIYPGPYKFILQRRIGSLTTNTYTPIYSISHNNYAQIGQVNNMIDTTSDDSLDTQNNQYYYKVAFYYTNPNNNTLTYLGNSAQASSIFLKAIPHDKKVILSWTVQTPWINDKYYILQQGYGGIHDNYKIIDSTTSTTYTVDSLTNKYNYCFKVLSKGEYANPLIQKYIWNYSEKVCAAPVDDEAPCQPTLAVSGNCPSSVNKLVWTNPNHTCHINDVVKYYIYYAPFQDSTLKFLDSLLNPNDTSYTTDFSLSIAGCYVIVAIDSVGNKSPLNNEVCTDNCPEYELPNIFTPNGDSLNDQYIPVKNKYIKDVEFTMYNRWGEIVFETTDPALKWDGKSKQMKQPVSDGTYYYICKVHELHYYGIKERTLKGFVQVLH